MKQPSKVKKFTKAQIKQMTDAINDSYYYTSIDLAIRHQQSYSRNIEWCFMTKRKAEDIKKEGYKEGYAQRVKEEGEIIPKIITENL